MTSEEVKIELLKLRTTLREQSIKTKMVTSGVWAIMSATLIILKAMGISSLSWFWTLAPLLWPLYLVGLIAAGFLTLAVIVFVIFLIIEGIEKYEKRNN